VVFAPVGIKTGNNGVFEGDAALRLPIGIGGEVFLAAPRAHAVTAGMLRGEEVRHRVFLRLAQSFTREPESELRILLESTPSPTALKSFRKVRDEVALDSQAPSFAMSVAGESPGAAQ